MSAGLRLVFAVTTPLLGASLVYELRHRLRACLLVAVITVGACAVLTLTVAPAVSGGGSVERGLGTAIPGVDITARGDAASIAVILIACLAALLAAPRHRDDGERLAGTLLCLAGAGFVAVAGSLVLMAGGVEIAVAGTMLLRGRHPPGARSAAALAGVLAGAGLALVAAAAQLVAQAGTSDLAFAPQGAINAAIAVPWALGGAALVCSSVIPGEGTRPARDWAAIASLPAGFLVLLRLQESAGGQLPAVAAVTLAVVGAAVAGAAAAASRGAVTVAATGRCAVGVLGGVLVSLFGGPLAGDGTILAGLFLAVELGLLAAPSWGRSPNAWAGASTALLALPGGAGFAVLVTGLATVAHRGAGAFPQLLVLTAAAAAAAVAVSRSLAILPRGWRPLLPGAAIAVVAGLGGGLLPGFALRSFAAPLAGGAAAADLDPGALALPGGGFAGGYFAAAAGVLIVGAAAALALLGNQPIVAAALEPGVRWLPPASRLGRLRRRVAPTWRAAAAGMAGLDRWLESQPGVPFLFVAVAVALVLLR